jgi:hypothetical protein
MTHTQNTLSFEHALFDASMLLREGDRNVLVGAADEHIDILEEIAAKMAFETGSPLTSGASFFILSVENQNTAGLFSPMFSRLAERKMRRRKLTHFWTGTACGLAISIWYFTQARPCQVQDVTWITCRWQVFIQRLLHLHCIMRWMCSRQIAA